jgi:hypothetical protein
LRHRLAEQGIVAADGHALAAADAGRPACGLIADGAVPQFIQCAKDAHAVPLIP